MHIVVFILLYFNILMLRHLSLNLSLKSTAQYLELAKKKSILTELDGGKKKRRNGVSTEILEVLKPSLKATVDTERKTEQHAVGREQGEQSLIIRHLQMKGSKVDFHHMDTREVTCLKKKQIWLHSDACAKHKQNCLKKPQVISTYAVGLIHTPIWVRRT